MTAHIYRISVDIGKDYEARCLARMGSDGCYQVVNVRNSYPCGRYQGPEGGNVRKIERPRRPDYLVVIEALRNLRKASRLDCPVGLSASMTFIDDVHQPQDREWMTWKTGRKDLPHSSDLHFDTSEW